MLSQKSITRQIVEYKKQMGRAFIENRKECKLPVEEVMKLTGLKKEQLFDIEHGLYQGDADSIIALNIVYDHYFNKSMNKIKLFCDIKEKKDDILELALQHIHKK